MGVCSAGLAREIVVGLYRLMTRTTGTELLLSVSCLAVLAAARVSRAGTPRSPSTTIGSDASSRKVVSLKIIRREWLRLVLILSNLTQSASQRRISYLGWIDLKD